MNGIGALIKQMTKTVTIRCIFSFSLRSGSWNDSSSFLMKPGSSHITLYDSWCFLNLVLTGSFWHHSGRSSKNTTSLLPGGSKSPGYQLSLHGLLRGVPPECKFQLSSPQWYHVEEESSPSFQSVRMKVQGPTWTYLKFLWQGCWGAALKLHKCGNMGSTLSLC